MSHFTYDQLFPDFVLDVELPEGFKDSCRLHDAFPSFVNEALSLRLGIEYTDPDRREYSEGQRFELFSYIDGEFDQPKTSDGIYLFGDPVVTDDYSEILAAIKVKAASLNENPARQEMSKRFPELKFGFPIPEGFAPAFEASKETPHFYNEEKGLVLVIDYSSEDPRFSGITDNYNRYHLYSSDNGSIDVSDEPLISSYGFISFTRELRNLKQESTFKP